MQTHLSQYPRRPSRKLKGTYDIGMREWWNKTTLEGFFRDPQIPPPYRGIQNPYPRRLDIWYPWSRGLQGALRKHRWRDLIFQPIPPGKVGDRYYLFLKIQRIFQDPLYFQKAPKVPPPAIPTIPPEGWGASPVASIYIFQVVCLDDPKLDSFYCSMCNYWSFPAGMFIHMETSEHRLAFLVILLYILSISRLFYIY